MLRCFEFVLIRQIAGPCRSLPCMLIGCFFLAMTVQPSGWAETFGQPWVRHTIDNTSQGADGVRPMDVNGNGRLDLVTPWEEGGVVRAYLHPGVSQVTKPWPAVTVGKVASPEDAVFVDLDGDGAIDVVSCCEGKNRSVFVHWAPPSSDQWLNSAAWKTAPFPTLAGQQAFMFCLPMQVDQQHGVDLVIGAKKMSNPPSSASQVGWLQSPANPRQLADWKWHPIYEAGWIMSLFAYDMDHDGDLDILLTDRKGPDRGCKWLENPGPDAALSGAAWRPHLIGGQDTEVMFADHGDLDGDGILDVVVATHDAGLQVWRGLDASGDSWERQTIAMPANTGGGKGVAIGDIDLDGVMDIVVTCEHATNKHGVFWLKQVTSAEGVNWTFQPICDELGIKFDLIQLIDMDEDGDLDVVTCEERTGLGVTWYENPAKP